MSTALVLSRNSRIKTISLFCPVGKGPHATLGLWLQHSDLSFSGRISFSLILTPWSPLKKTVVTILDLLQQIQGFDMWPSLEATGTTDRNILK